MGLVRFGVGIIEDSGWWQVFFSLFRNFFERPHDSNCRAASPVLAFLSNSGKPAQKKIQLFTRLQSSRRYPGSYSICVNQAGRSIQINENNFDETVTRSTFASAADHKFPQGSDSFPHRHRFPVVGPNDSLQPSRVFTGLIEEIGKVLWIRATDRGTQLQIAAPILAEDTHTGDSISINGCCLTVTSHRAEQITFDLLNETLDRTNLGKLRRDDPINLERPLASTGRLGGHFVQGHIDCAAKIISFDQAGGDSRLEVELPAKFAQYIISKGSIAVNGISLTVTEVRPDSFAVNIIPHTRRTTNLQSAKPGELLNLEFDVLAKYVERIITHREKG